MPEFIRRFAVEALGAYRDSRGLAALFERWILPGEPAGSHGLRLAIRKDYMNFYLKGQSVGRLLMRNRSPCLELHPKYVHLAEKHRPRARDLGQKYVRVNTEDISETALDAWIRTAETYAGDEKRFVDDLVAVTPGTVDTEVALPTGDDARERSAPRMDLVVAQDKEIAFWEAKCAINSELRARAPYTEEPDGVYRQGPTVLWQLRRYERWVRRPHRLEEVRKAYVATAQHLLALAEMFNKRGPAIDGWQALARAGKDASVILPPGIVVADYCPTRADGRNRSESAEYVAMSRSFHDHESRLVAHGAKVTRVSSVPECAVLPYLKPGAIIDKGQRL